MHGVSVGTPDSLTYSNALAAAAKADPGGRVFVLPESAYVRIASALRNFRSLAWRLRQEASFLHPDRSSMVRRFNDLADAIDSLQQPATDSEADAQFWVEVWAEWERGTRGEAFLDYLRTKLTSQGSDGDAARV
jgi:hypothetical protein